MMKNIYKKMYSNLKNSGSLADSPRIKNMAAIINWLNIKNGNILDIGCHDGTFLSLVKNRNNNFYGIEASDWGARQARKKGIDVRQYFFDDQTKMPYEGEFFDVVVAGDIIEHIFNTDFFLDEISRVLKPDGKLLISTPNLASFGRRVMLFLGMSPIIEISPNEPDSVGHIRYFTFSSLRKLLEKNNFRVISSSSDCVNFSKVGRVRFSFLAKIFPGLGASIICLVKKL